MRRLLRSRRSQRGAALLVFATVLVLGVTWYAVDTLGNSATRVTTQREMKTGAALRAAKQALLGYAAQYAASTCVGVSPPCPFEVPGRLPCPESVNAIGTLEEGEASGNCTLPKIGRLPWQTLGMEPLRDGDGELLWYVLSAGFRDPPINFGTPGQLTLDGAANAAVALIIAPGKSINSLGEPGTPPTGCSAVNQHSGRYANPLDPTKFLECGNATGSYVTAGSLPWSNDRVIAVTAAELMDAIAGPVADRLQREVVPRLEYWRSTVSNDYWGVRFLPHASTYSDPATNDLCGDTVSGAGVTEGLIPTARSTDACTRWAAPNTQGQVGGSGSISTPACGPLSSGAWRCFITYSGSPVVRITATAPNVTGSFRGRISSGDISSSVGGTIEAFSLALNPATGAVTVSVDIDLPWKDSSTGTQIVIPTLPEPVGMATDPETKWFIQNGWDRFVYYAISPGVRANPGATCSFPGASGCLVVNGLPSGTGNPDDKRLVLALMGRPIGAQTMPILESGSHAMPSPADYTAVPAAFTATVPSSTINDRLAMCPFMHTAHGGTTLTLCN